MDRGLRPLRHLLPLRRGRCAARGLASSSWSTAGRSPRARSPGRTSTLFGEPIESTFWAWFAVVRRGHRRLRARLDRRLGDRALRREAVPGTARAVAPRHAREARPGRALVRALRRDHRLRLADAARRALVHLHPGRDRRDAARPLHRSDDPREHPLVRGSRRDRRGRRRELGGVPPRVPLRGHRRADARRRGRDLRALAPPPAAAASGGLRQGST